MPKITSTLARIGLLVGLLTLIAAFPMTSSSGAQADRPQCSDGQDNDSDNAVDGADAGCTDGSDNDETDSPYFQIVTVPLPLVTLQGTVSAKGVVKVKKLEIRAQRGSTVRVSCKGKKCPFSSFTRVMITSTLRLKKVERKLKPKLTLTLKIGRPGNLGKYVRYAVKRNAAPVRFDSCLDPTTGKVRGCFAG
jgi:hypothetical protein